MKMGPLPARCSKNLMLALFCGLLCLAGVAQSQLYQCDFETAAGTNTTMVPCGLIQETSDKMDWLRHQGPTTSGQTGPDTDHTTGTAKGHYMYMEASFQEPGDQAIIRLPAISGLRGPSCLYFWYHMYGLHVGLLNVTVNNAENVVFSRQRNQSFDWLRAEVPLYTAQIYSVTILAERGGTIQGQPYGDICIDDIRVDSGPCPSVPMTTTPGPSTRTASTVPTTTTRTTTPAPTPTPTPPTQPTKNPTAPTDPSKATPPTEPSELQTSSPTASTTPYTGTTESTTSGTTVSSTSTPSTTTVTTDESSNIEGTVTSADPDTERSAETKRSSSSTTTTPTATEITSSAITLEPVSSSKLWGLNENLWIIILVVLCAVILVLLIVVGIQACAMRRMRMARIVKQSDDYSNIEHFEKKAFTKDNKDYINAYDNVAITDDNGQSPTSNGGGGLV